MRFVFGYLQQGCVAREAVQDFINFFLGNNRIFRLQLGNYFSGFNVLKRLDCVQNGKVGKTVKFCCPFFRTFKNSVSGRHDFGNAVVADGISRCLPAEFGAQLPERDLKTDVVDFFFGAENPPDTGLFKGINVFAVEFSSFWHQAVGKLNRIEEPDAFGFVDVKFCAFHIFRHLQLKNFFSV